MGRKRLGLQWVRTSDAIRDFVSEYGHAAPRRALFCTYEFEAERFEAILFPELMRRGRQFRTLVVADAAALQSEFSKAGQRQFDKYEVAPVRCAKGGVFHPKLVFLTAGGKHLAGIGSANLTSGGLGANLELMLWADDSTEEGRQLVGGAAYFVGRLRSNQSVQIPSSAVDFMEATVAGVRTWKDVTIDSLEQDLLSQMVSTVSSGGRKEPATRELWVLSPWHSAGRMPEGAEPVVVQRLQEAFAAKVTVYTQGCRGKCPDLGVPVHIRKKSPGGATDEQENDDTSEVDWASNRWPERVHAKAYLVKTNQGGTLFVGSANCTVPALQRPVPAGGNVEILVPSHLGRMEVSRFERDLTDLFVPAPETFPVEPSAHSEGSTGVILCGRLIRSKVAVRLDIEAPAVERGSAFIGSKKDSCTIKVGIKAGAGAVSSQEAIKKLFPDGVPALSEPCWGCLLWEKVGRDAVPFPVSVPLLAPAADQPDVFFRDLALEEMGIWPSSDRTDTVNNGGDQGEDNQDRNQEEEIRTLTESEHQGELDRLAVAAAVLRKHLARAAGGKEYAHSRLEMVRRKLALIKVRPHIRNVLLEYFEKLERKSVRHAR